MAQGTETTWACLEGLLQTLSHTFVHCRLVQVTSAGCGASLCHVLGPLSSQVGHMRGFALFAAVFQLCQARAGTIGSEERGGDFFLFLSHSI